MILTNLSGLLFCHRSAPERSTINVRNNTALLVSVYTVDTHSHFACLV
jgi:hypothetical protein